MTSVLDYKDRATCVLFGDGAGAVLLEAAGPNEGILDFEHDVDGRGERFSTCQAAGRSIPPARKPSRSGCTMSIRKDHKCFKYAVRRMTEMAAHLLEKNGFTKKI